MRPLAVARLVSVLSLLPVTAIAQVPLGSEFLVNTYTIGTQGVARVASEDGGDFVVVWAGSPAYPSGFGYFTHIHGQRFASSGSALGSEFQISTYTALADPRGHAVASDSDGDFVVVWAQVPGQSGDRRLPGPTGGGHGSGRRLRGRVDSRFGSGRRRTANSVTASQAEPLRSENLILAIEIGC